MDVRDSARVREEWGGTPYQTLQQASRPGDDDEDPLDQFGDDGHLLAVGTFVRLIRGRTRGWWIISGT